jgi:predicted acylesterase/phospholipase RssA
MKMSDIVSQINGCKALKDRHYYKDALEILGHIEDKDGTFQDKIIRLKAECTYQNHEIPSKSRFEDALNLLDTATEQGKETLRLRGAIFKRKYMIFKRVEDLIKAIEYYSQAALDIEDDKGYGAVNAIFLHYTLKKLLGDSVSDTQINEIRQKAIESLCGLEDKDKDDWTECTLAELYLGIGDYDNFEKHIQNIYSSQPNDNKNLQYLKESIELTDDQIKTIDKAVQIRAKRAEYVTAEQMVKLHEVLPESIVKDDKRFVTALSKFLQIDEVRTANFIHSIRIGKVGLALSGGGFRASLFHIGVLERLAELDILRHVSVISSVSGGSILAMHYYIKLKKLLDETPDSKITRDDYINIVKKLKEEFTVGIKTNIRMRAIADICTPTTQALGQQYQKNLFDRASAKTPKKMRDLYISPHSWSIEKNGVFKPHFHNLELINKVPILIINATVQNNGHNWRFTASGMGENPHMYDSTTDKNRVYEYQRYEDFPPPYNEMSIGDAVAASSAVPGLFDPIKMEGIYTDTTIALSDGGVYDNQGIASIIDEECNIVIVSDASKQLNEINVPPLFRFGMISRTNDVLMNKIRDTEFELAKEMHKNGRIDALAIIHLKHGFGVETAKTAGKNSSSLDSHLYIDKILDKDVQKKLANIRTDLDAFHEMESSALMHSGYEISSYMFKEQNVWAKYWDVNTNQEVDYNAIKNVIEHNTKHILKILEVSGDVLFKPIKLVFMNYSIEEHSLIKKLCNKSKILIYQTFKILLIKPILSFIAIIYNVVLNKIYLKKGELTK